MKFVFYTNSVSPHQIPLASEIVEYIGCENYRYIYTTPLCKDRRELGWSLLSRSWIVCEADAPEECKMWLENCDVLITGFRCIDLFRFRSANGLKSIYAAERWFKPWLGILRLFKPSYLKMSWNFVRLLRNSDEMTFFPMGIHAAKDMARICGLFAGDIRCLFLTPKLMFEKKVGGRIFCSGKHGRCVGRDKKYCLDKMRMWGYYVEPSKNNEHLVQRATTLKPQEIRVLWVGRLLNWKRVDTIVRAVREHANLKCVDNTLPKVTLDIYGTGPEEKKLKEMSTGYEDLIRFFPPVPIAEVRKLMQEHDVYVLSSNSYEGWGAVVSEALEEGMSVIGTYEAGSCGTFLPETNLFHVGDWKRLGKLLRSGLRQVSIGEWTAKNAANNLINICNI